MSGEWWTFGVVGALALGGVAAKRRGSGAILDPQSGYDRIAFRRQLGLPPTVSLPDASGAPIAETTLRQSPDLWDFFSQKVYGSFVDLPLMATREALQNSRDAIDDAWRNGLIKRDQGRFDVTWDAQANSLTWEDNGGGMTQEIVFDKFLRLPATSKRSTGGATGGGFGIAKAVILGVSKTFRWELHSLDKRYVANGTDRPVLVYSAPMIRGTRLTVYDVDPKYRYWYYGLGGPIESRLARLLAANDLRSSDRHAQIRVSLNGTAIAPAFAGRGKVIGEDLSWGPGTEAKVRVYRRSEVGGGLYIRLDGLYQFARGFSAPLPFDVTADLTTSMSPRDDAYPLEASRNNLSGPAYEAAETLVRNLTTDFLSATKGKVTVEVMDVDEGDLDELRQNRQEFASELNAMLDDPDVKAGLDLVHGGASRFREQTDEIQRRRAARQAEQARVRQQEQRRNAPPGQQQRRVAPPTFPTGAGGISQQRAPRPSPDQLRAEAAQAEAQGRRKRRTNPFAGIAVWKVNREHYFGGLTRQQRAALSASEAADLLATRRKRSSALRKYFDRPEQFHGLLLAWQLACQLVLQESQGRKIPFQVGFILDDDVRAEWEGGDGKNVLYLNPEWFAKTVKAYGERPLAVAAILHAKACHEITHLLGAHSHNENFVASRETLAEVTINVLYPLTKIVERALKLKPANTPEERQISRLRGELSRLRGKRKVGQVREVARQQMVQQVQKAGLNLSDLIAEAVRQAQQEQR